jgi:antitoxin (DNA-binding transcriptional repressor) of toxin-antitoxin stability system
MGLDLDDSEEGAMKIISICTLKKNFAASIKSAQKGPIMIMRYGKPVAVLMGVQGCDWDDLDSISNRFWQKFVRGPRP